MIKQKYVVLAGVVVGVLAVGGGGFWYWQGHQQDDHTGPGAASIQAAATIDGTGSQQHATDQTSNQAQASTSSGLKAGSSSATDLGQLAPSTSSGSSSSNGQSATGQSSSSASNPFDPSTFSAYDKYKDSTTALEADVQVGTGTALTSGHQASVYYKGWLTNGQLFDESRTGSDGKLQPFAFTLGAGQVIQGWEQGLAGMKVGGTRMLVVPPAVGYGATGQGSIPGNAVLVFEVQLLAVK